MATLERIAIDYQALVLLYVDYIGKTSNFFEDLLKLDRFSKSFEDELNRIVTKEEESREDL